jgi:hypothetical protein
MRHQNQSLEGQFSVLNHQVKGRETNHRIDNRHTSHHNTQGRLQQRFGVLTSTARKRNGEPSEQQKYFSAMHETPYFWHPDKQWKQAKKKARAPAPSSTETYAEQAELTSQRESEKRTKKGRGKKRKVLSEADLTEKAQGLKVAEPEPKKRKGRKPAEPQQPLQQEQSPQPPQPQQNGAHLEKGKKDKKNKKDKHQAVAEVPEQQADHEPEEEMPPAPSLAEGRARRAAPLKRWDSGIYLY